MSHPEEAGSGDLVIIARAVRTRGLQGEIVADLLTDFPERFEGLAQLVLVSPGGERKVAKLEGYWFQKNRVILKLADCDDVETAKEFTGYEFAVPESDRVPLPADRYYDWELEGCSVRILDGESIGKVRSVIKTGGVEILVVSDEAGRERLVPLAASIVVAVDVVGKMVVVDPPEGLFDL